MAAVTFDAVIFDLDGTVWDSAPGIFSSIHATLDEMRITHDPDADLTHELGPPLAVMLARLGVAENEIDRGVEIYRRHYRERGEHECVPFDGIPGLLDDLRATGHRLATATSKGHEPANRMLEEFDLARRFDAVAAASMTSTHDTKVDIIGQALSGLGVEPGPRVAMVGDRNFDIDGGNALGCTSIGVTWGYAADGELTGAGADVVCDTVDALRTVLLGTRPG